MKGVEDPLRFERIGQPARDSTRARIAVSPIALGVDPQPLRSQDQLRIHLLKRPGLDQPMGEDVVGQLREPLDVRGVTARRAADRGQDNDSVLVATSVRG